MSYHSGKEYLAGEGIMHYQYVPARTSHILHIILTVLTLGLWFPIWMVIWIRNHNRMVARPLPAPIVTPVYRGPITYPQPRTFDGPR
jgi:hypothetical protein